MAFSAVLFPVLVLILALGLVLVAGIAAITYTDLNMVLLAPLNVSDPPRPAQAIAVLSGGFNADGSLGSSTIERMDRGIELFRQGYAPAMILSGGDRYAGRPEAEAMADYGRRHGIPPEVMLVEGHSLSTAQNAANIAAIAGAHGWRTVILVTSPYHARRAVWMLRDQGLEMGARGAGVNGTELDVISAPAVRSEVYGATGLQRLRAFRLITLEYLKLVKYLIFRT